jgi:hypothetical protein
VRVKALRVLTRVVRNPATTIGADFSLGMLEETLPRLRDGIASVRK